MPKQSIPSITLFPPKVEISKKTDKYDLVIDVSWGDFEKEIRINKEIYDLQGRTNKLVNEAFLEASETTKPYIIHDINRI